MKSRNHFPLFQVCFGLMLVAVFFGWLGVVLELVQRDAEVAEARVKEAEERYLEDLAERFDMFKSQMPVNEGFVKLAAETGGYVGVWIREEARREPFVEVEAWPEGIDPKSSEDLLNHREILKWGEVENGRDRLGSRVLKIARDERENFEAVEILREGVWRYDEIDRGGVEGNLYVGGLMSPGFRLLLIRELEKWEPSVKLERLKFAERIRAVEGRIYELPGEFERQPSLAETADFFYTKEQLQKMIGSGDVMVSADRPEGRASVRVQGLERWPYLSLMDGHALEAKAVAGSKRAIYWIGLMTLISTIALIAMAVWMGRRQLQQAWARTDLAASVAHELRTPLAGQRVVLESMLKREKFDENYLKMALRENERLGDLSEEFLTFSRLERGVLELQVEPFDLTGFVKSVAGDFSAQHEDSEVVFVGDAEVEVKSDKAAISTIVRNLLENAWKYSEAPHRIEVSVFEEGFAVKDEGVGLSAGEQKKIFRQFYRVEKKLSRSQDGLGLGLSIVKRLVDAMEGRIDVESKKGKGSTFTVFLQKGGLR